MQRWQPPASATDMSAPTKSFGNLDQPDWLPSSRTSANVEAPFAQPAADQVAAFRFPQSAPAPHALNRTGGSDRQLQRSSSAKRSDSGGNPHKRPHLAIRTSADHTDKDAGHASIDASQGGSDQAVAVSQIPRPRVAPIPYHSAPQPHHSTKRPEEPETRPGVAVPFSELSRAAFHYATKQADHTAETQLRAFDSALGFCNSYQRPKQAKPLPLLSLSSASSATGAQTKHFYAPLALPYLPVHTALPNGLELAKDDSILRCFPDPTLVPDTTDLGDSHYSQLYTHPLTDACLLKHTQSGVVDTLVAAVLHALAYLLEPHRDPNGSYRKHLGYKLERAFDSLLWSPERTKRVSRLYYIHELIARLAGPCLPKTEKVEALLCVVWYTVAKRILRPPSHPLAVLAPPATGSSGSTAKLQETAMEVFLDNFCPDCDLFGCSHVDPLFKSHRPPRLSQDPTPSTWDLSLPCQPCSPNCWVLQLTIPTTAPSFDTQTITAVTLSLNMSLSPCTVALVHQTACRDVFALARRESELHNQPDSRLAFPPSSTLQPLPSTSHPEVALVSSSSSQRKSDSRRKGTPQRRPPPPAASAIPGPSSHRSPTRAKSARAPLATSSTASNAVTSSGTSNTSAAVDYGSLPLAFPCDCTGSCNVSSDDHECSCRQGGHFCDDVCQCSPTCANRWQGCLCACASGSRHGQSESGEENECCRLKRDCACVRAGRECGRMCKCSRGPKGVEVGCMNRVIGAKLIDPEECTYIDISLVPNGGWGLFAQQALPRSFPLGEYTGEVITNDEADRRGLVYDEMQLNFFFDLANDAVVDAFRLGNALRFINHANGKAANVEPKVVMVKGSQRIVLRTKRAVPEGQELLMDYGPNYRLWKGAKAGPA